MFAKNRQNQSHRKPPQLDPIATPSTKDKDMTGNRIFFSAG